MKLSRHFVLLLLTCWYGGTPNVFAVERVGFQVELTSAHHGFDGKTCFVHARAAAISASPPTVLITTVPLRISGDDVFYAVHDLLTRDGGKTWSEPSRQASFARRPLENGLEEGFINPSPKWHAKSGVVLCIGDCVRYKNDELEPHPHRAQPAYACFDPKQGTWTSWKKLELPLPEFFMTYTGSDQRVDLPNGDILLPTCYMVGGPNGKLDSKRAHMVATVLRCTFDGKTLRYVKRGPTYTVAGGEGLSEPSLTHFNGRYYLTLRNNDAGCVTSGKDGMTFDRPIRWTYDDGADLGNYRTQQHWVTHSNGLFLVYTRRGAHNDHVVRNRAPLFIAQVDPERLCIIRDTERVLVPERGARLGNFGVVDVSPQETWVIAAEWMQTKGEHWNDPSIPASYGSDNTIFVAKMKWQTPNRLAGRH